MQDNIYDNNDYVCNCKLVTVKDVKDFIKVYPFMPSIGIKAALGIGSSCGCCNSKNCPNIVITFDDLILNLNKS